MTNRTYPPLPDVLGQQLEAIRVQAEFDPEYLTDTACPYSEKVRIFLRRLVIPSQVSSRDLVDSVFRKGQSETDRIESLIEEVRYTINQMKALADQMSGENVDTSERMTFLKNYAPLIDRYLALQEKAQGLKQMYDFQRVVMDVMEQVLDKDARLELKKRLKAANVNDVADRSPDAPVD